MMFIATSGLKSGYCETTTPVNTRSLQMDQPILFYAVLNALDANFCKACSMHNFFVFKKLGNFSPFPYIAIY